MKKINVVAAVIKHDRKFLCVQRGENKLDYISKKYEFPGGKVEEGETLEAAIIREIQEELDMAIQPESHIVTVKHQYPDFHLTMHTFMCSCENPNVTLTEHIDYKWLLQEELNQLDWAAADIPIVDELMQS